jgi:hypothetical protein
VKQQAALIADLQAQIELGSLERNEFISLSLELQVLREENLKLYAAEADLSTAQSTNVESQVFMHTYTYLYLPIHTYTNLNTPIHTYTEASEGS